MKNVTVNSRKGKTTSIIPHRNGSYPVWFLDINKVEFIDAELVIFTTSS